MNLKHETEHGQLLATPLLASIVVCKHIFQPAQSLSFQVCFFNPFLYKSSVRVFDRLSFVIHSRGGCQGLCFLRYSTVDFKVCLGSLSCCRSHPLSYYSIYTDGLVFACRICWYFIESILLSTTEMFPVPLAETQAKSMIDLSPCLAVATVVLFFF